MAEITLRRAGELLRGVFHLLDNVPDGRPAREVLGELEKLVPPTTFEASNYPATDVRRYERVVRFQSIPSVKAGWLTKTKGRWSLTDEGRKAYKQFTDPEQFMRESVRLYKKWEQTQPEEADATPPAPTSNAGNVTLEKAEEEAWSEIESYLAEMSPYDFQDLVAGLLRGMGYHVAWVSPPGADDGIDIIAHSDPLGITGPRIKVQVKRKAETKVGVEGIRSFMAILSDGDIGLFVASGGFSKEAEREARRQEKRRIMLVDLDRLFDLWVEHYQHVPEEPRRLLPLKPVYFLAHEE
jgi:restriction system protein